MADANTRGRGRGRKGRKLAPRSSVWNHFDRIIDDQGNLLRSVCKYCKQEYVGSYGTSNLTRHYNDLCPEREAAAVEAPAPGALEEASKHLARMIALRGYNPSLVEDDCFRSFVASLNPEFKVPSRDDIKDMSIGIIAEARRNLFSKLRRALGRISLAVGTERTTEGEKVAYRACHFIDDEWNLQKVVLDAYVVVPFETYYSHFSDTREITHKAINVIIDIDEYGFSNRLFMMAWEEKGLKLKERVKEKLSYTYPARQELICTSYADNMLRSIARSLIISDYIRESYFPEILSMTTQRRQQILTDFQLDYHHWAHGEDWYFCYCYSKVFRMKYPNACLDLLQEILCNIWGEILRAIQTNSASSCPTSHLCLGELFNVREILQSELARFSAETEDETEDYADFYYRFVNEFADVLRKAKDTLDEAIKDSYLVWSIPHVLDPRCKFKYIKSTFERAFGPETAGNMTIEVTRKIKELYDTDHSGDESDDDGDSDTDHIRAESDDGGDSDQGIAMTAHNADPLGQAWDELHRLQLQDGIGAPEHHPEVRTDLDCYLEDPVIPRTEDFDILNWWKDHSDQYPTVAQMARNALTMPASSILSSEQIAHVRSLVRGYSKEIYKK